LIIHVYEMPKRIKNYRRVNPLGINIITCNGQIVRNNHLNESENDGKVICSCDRIVQHIRWEYHTKSIICRKLHLELGTIPTFQIIKLLN